MGLLVSCIYTVSKKSHIYVYIYICMQCPFGQVCMSHGDVNLLFKTARIVLEIGSTSVIVL